jgi:hypothetical protein
VSLLLDTGAVYALADEDDRWHPPVRDLILSAEETLLVPATALCEIAYLVRSRLGEAAERAFAESLAAGELLVENVTRPDLARTARLMKQFPFLGFVDASVVSVAERLKLTSLVTTDRRDFSRVRPIHVKSFELLP